jgi:hypothetical protein
VAINVNDDGTVSLISASVDLTGSRTSVAMQAAEVLGQGNRKGYVKRTRFSPDKRGPKRRGGVWS